MEIKYFVLICIILTFFTQCKKGQVSYKGWDFEENQIYLFYRETKSKAGMVSKSYNINNSNYSHVGIGGIINNKVTVYHILYDKENDKQFHKSELRIEKVEDFYNPKMIKYS